MFGHHERHQGYVVENQTEDEVSTGQEKGMRVPRDFGTLVVDLARAAVNTYI